MPPGVVIVTSTVPAVVFAGTVAVTAVALTTVTWVADCAAKGYTARSGKGSPGDGYYSAAGKRTGYGEMPVTVGTA